MTATTQNSSLNAFAGLAKIEPLLFWVKNCWHKTIKTDKSYVKHVTLIPTEALALPMGRKIAADENVGSVQSDEETVTLLP